MPRLRSLLPLLLALAPLVHAADPTPGDTRQETENRLGKPVAVIKTANGDLLAKYARGTVTYRNNRAVKIALLLPEELAKRKADELVEAEAAATRARLAAESAARRTAEGNRERDALIASDLYRQLTVRGRLAALDTLAEKHPDAELVVLRRDLRMQVEREESVERARHSDAAARRELEEKLAELTKRLDEQAARLVEAASANTRLTARLENTELAASALARRVKMLEEEAAATRAAPAGK